VTISQGSKVPFEGRLTENWHEEIQLTEVVEPWVGVAQSFFSAPQARCSFPRGYVTYENVFASVEGFLIDERGQRAEIANKSDNSLTSSSVKL
jgi:hypothetical protein